MRFTTPLLEAPPMPPGVDTGRPCARYWDGTIKRVYPIMRVRRELALRYGALPGRAVLARCQYCPFVGLIHWPYLASGKLGSVVLFIQLTMDYVHPYSRGGETNDPDNLVLACKRCNSSKNDRLGWTGRST